MQARNYLRKLVIFNLIRPSTHFFLNEYIYNTLWLSRNDFLII